MRNTRLELPGDFLQLLSKEKTLISVILPALNEDATLGPVLLRTHRTLQSLGSPYEVIVVDDGSTDDTAQIALACGAKVISNGGNLGKGYALYRGICEAKGQVIATMDADGENRPEELPILLNPILDGSAEADAVIGSRFTGNLKLGAVSCMHLLGNRIINIVIFLLTGRWVTDSLSGFRVFKRRAIQDMHFNSKGYEIEAEMTVKMLKRGFLVKEVPITYHKRIKGSSRLHTFKDGFRILKTVLKVFFGRQEVRRIVRRVEEKKKEVIM